MTRATTSPGSLSRSARQVWHPWWEWTYQHWLLAHKMNYSIFGRQISERKNLLNSSVEFSVHSNWAYSSDPPKSDRFDQICNRWPFPPAALVCVINVDVLSTFCKWPWTRGKIWTIIQVAWKFESGLVNNPPWIMPVENHRPISETPWHLRQISIWANSQCCYNFRLHSGQQIIEFYMGHWTGNI